MPFRYALLVGSHDKLSESVKRIAQRLDFTCIPVSPNVVALANQPGNCAILPGSRGIIVGDYFEKASLSGQRRLPTDHSVAIEDAAGAFEAGWGAYVTCMLGSGHVDIARDPSALLPCFFRHWEGLWVFASDVPLIADVTGIALTVDWDGVARSLYANGLIEAGTALNGVQRLLPGSKFRIRTGSVEVTPVWSPWLHANKPHNSLEDFRTVILSVIDSWANRFETILVGVSGGLDSSIVASALRQSNKSYMLTVSTDDARGDERGYARALCEHIGVGLIEQRYELANVDITRSSFIHAPRPGGRAQLQAYDKVVHQEAIRCGANMFFTGLGGDNVFYSTSSARPLVDLCLTKGATPAFFATLRDIGRLTGAGPWQILRHALRVPRAPGPKYQWRSNTRFLEPALVAELQATPLDHPWLQGPENCLPGKAAHVAMIVRAHLYPEAQDRRVPLAQLHPLMSQPIVEACLAVPGWEACADGLDRSFARRAFMNDLPRTVYNRREKGGPDAFAIQIIRANLPEIRERLLYGDLVKHGLINRSELEPALTEQGLARGTDYARILSLLDTEAWVRCWSTGDLRPAF